MEKISRILPSSNRFKISDDSDNLPGRPGAQMLGRDVGANDIRDRVTRSSAAAGKMGFDDFSTYKEPKEAARTRIADNIAKRFFPEREAMSPQMAQPSQVEFDSSPNIVVLPVMVIPNQSEEQIRTKVETPSVDVPEIDVAQETFEPSTQYAVE